MFARWPGEAIQAETIACGVDELVGAPGEVLADHVAVARARDVAGRADAVDGRLAAGRDVREVVIGDQFLAVAFGGLFELWRGSSGLSSSSARLRLIRHSTAAWTTSTFPASGVNSVFWHGVARTEAIIAAVCSRGGRASAAGAGRRGRAGAIAAFVPGCAVGAPQPGHGACGRRGWQPERGALRGGARRRLARRVAARGAGAARGPEESAVGGGCGGGGQSGQLRIERTVA